MTSVAKFRGCFNAEDIFRAVTNAAIKYEEELDCLQRKLNWGSQGSGSQYRLVQQIPP